jgi:hypothetical protein
MHMRSHKTALTGLTLIAAFLAAPLGAQERTVLSKAVSVGRSEASLELEFQDQERLDIALRDGSVYIDDQVVGAYQAGDDLDAAFRALLGQAVALDDGELADMLVAWTPPDDLPADRKALADSIDSSLERALTRPAQDAAATSETRSIRVEGSNDSRLLGALLSQAGRLGFLEEALSGLDDVQIHVQEDVTVDEGETVEGALLVVGGDVSIAGVVTGDVVVVDGTLELEETGEIQGDVRLADARFDRAGGSLRGEIRDLSEEEGTTVTNGRDVREMRDQIRSEIRDELRSELRNELRGRNDFSLGSGILNPFRGLFRAIGGLLENVVTIFLLGLVGMGIIAFAPRNLDAVAETARRAPGRAATVGLAGTFLLLPVYVLGMVALAISIVGIPVLIAWIPLFPLAAVAAGILGYVAVARNVGEWLSDSGYRYTDWIRRSNAVYTVFGGLLGLGLFFLVAEALHVVPFSGFFRGIFAFAGFVVTFAAVMVGFGSVLLTRAGRRPEFYPMDPEEAWRQAVDPELDDMDVGTEDPPDTATSGAGTDGAAKEDES